MAVFFIGGQGVWQRVVCVYELASGLCVCSVLYAPKAEKVRLVENEPTDAVLDLCKVVMLFRCPDGFAFND